MNCTYLVLPIAELNNVDYSEVLQNSADTVRKSLDGSEFIVKWDGVMPPSIYEIAPIGDEDVKDCLTHSEARALMQTADWLNDEQV